MSLFPQNEGISEIRQRTREELLVQALNDSRLRPQQAYDCIQDKLSQSTPDTKCIQFDGIGKILLEADQDLQQAREYFLSLSKMQQVIGDLYFNEQYNQDFAKIHGTEEEEAFKSKLSIKSMHDYSVQAVDPALYGDLICFLVLEEYFTKCRRNTSHTESSLCLDQIALLSNHFNLCFVILTGSEIRLWIGYTCNFLSISHIVTPCLFSTSRQAEQPQFNYEFIPIGTVYELFTRMDVNRDGRIGPQDIQREFQKLSIDVGEEVVRGMFEEAIANRAVIFEYQRTMELTLRELYMAVQVKKKKQHQRWVLKPKWSTNYWLMLLKGLIGYDVEKKKKENCGFGKSGSIRVKFIPTKPYVKKTRPSGDISFRNTMTVRQIDNKPKPKVTIETPVERFINNKIKSTSKCGYNTIGFETRKIYDLSLRNSLANLRS